MPISPQAIADRLLVWYAQNARPLPFRENLTPYTTWISEIMLQQTRMTAVLPYYERFLAAFPDVFALAEAEEDCVLKQWEGLGYYSRAKNLRKAAQQIVAAHGGVLPADQAALLMLPGIGDYTAGAILSIAYGIPAPAVDGNVLRVRARLYNDNRPIDEPAAKQAARDFLTAVLTKENANPLTQAVMELGALVCLPGGAPLCGECPLGEVCLAKRENRTAALPVRRPKKPRRIEEKTVFILENGGKTALIKGEKGVLAGLYQLPAVPGRLDKEQAKRALLSLLPALLEGEFLSFESLGHYTHIFSHVEWHMAGYAALLKTGQEGGLFWADRGALEHDIALPSAFRPFRAARAAWEKK